jgi:hypothetical protein
MGQNVAGSFCDKVAVLDVTIKKKSKDPMFSEHEFLWTFLFL